MPSSPPPRTLIEKIWDRHLVAKLEDGVELIHIDRHVLQETTSARAFAALRRHGVPALSPSLALATVDHLVSTVPGRTEDSFLPGRDSIRLFRENCRTHGIELLDGRPVQVAHGACGRRGHWAVYPPSTGIRTPVTYDASSERRNATTAATSSGEP